VKDLVEKRGIEPDAITIITFTKEAADNMRRRISDEEKKDVFISPDRRPGRITTMHSLGLEVIRSYAAKLGLSDDFRVMSDSRLRRVLFRDASLLCDHGEPEAKAADMVRQQAAHVDRASVSAEIITQYEGILRASNAVDYDDQILLACEILESDIGVRDKYAATTKHLLVDEYQDINTTQKKLISLLSRSHPEGLFVVGDDDQSVYNFRGGTPKYVREFHQEYGSHPGAQRLCLVESRRCPDTILRAALSVVQNFDPNRIPKPEATFAAKKENGHPVQIHNVATDDQEARIIAAIARGALPKKSVLVLIPSKQYADKIKRELRRGRIAYTHSPSLDDSGFAMLQTVYEWIQDRGNNFALRLCMEALCNSGAIDIPSEKRKSADLTAKRRSKLAQIASLWQGVIGGRHSNLCDALESSTKADGEILVELRQHMSALCRVKSNEIENFLSIAAKNLRPWRNQEAFMKEVGNWMEELRTHGRGGEGAVKIMTLQAAKGLEADIVCVTGLNNGILPRDGATSQDLEETARLIYVSMTRAQHELHLFHARKRDGSVTYLRESFALTPSPFMGAIDPRDKELQYHQAPSKNKAVKSDRRDKSKVR
jgi:ATP-dependent DNA helicase Rep